MRELARLRRERYAEAMAREKPPPADAGEKVAFTMAVCLNVPEAAAAAAAGGEGGEGGEGGGARGEGGEGRAGFDAATAGLLAALESGGDAPLAAAVAAAAAAGHEGATTTALATLPLTPSLFTLTLTPKPIRPNPDLDPN